MSPPAFTLDAIHLNVLPMRTRFPFRYGIASMTWVPHLFVTVDLVVDGRPQRGVAADGLPPKWFTKDPATTFEQDLPQMLAVIQNGCRLARNAGQRESSFADWWRDVQDEQTRWAAVAGVPGLLAGLGVSLPERAVLDALCRAAGQPLHVLLRENRLLPDLGIARAELNGLSPAQVLPTAPLEQVAVRHTVGLADPLTDSDVSESERLDDGLPQTLEACARVYGLRYFKIKLGGEIEADRERLARIAEVVDRTASSDWRCTLDGNEVFRQMAAFQAHYRALQEDPRLQSLLQRVLFVEQPLHRDAALLPEVSAELSRWSDAPLLLIDESDASLDSLPTALRCGYRGISHKNCKGIVKGLANAALLRQSATPGLLLSGEDLGSVGPVSMFQDLTMQALLGVDHVERNGHHYFRGLSMLPDLWQEQALAGHSDLLERHAEGFPVLRIQRGMLSTRGLNALPFGVAVSPDIGLAFEPLNDWIRRGGLDQAGA